MVKNYISPSLQLDRGEETLHETSINQPTMLNQVNFSSSNAMSPGQSRQITLVNWQQSKPLLVPGIGDSNTLEFHAPQLQYCSNVYSRGSRTMADEDLTWRKWAVVVRVSRVGFPKKYTLLAANLQS